MDRTYDEGSERTNAFEAVVPVQRKMRRRDSSGRSDKFQRASGPPPGAAWGWSQSKPPQPNDSFPTRDLNSQTSLTVADRRAPRGSRRPKKPAIGSSLGGFRILEELGRGGMGVVYRVEELATGDRYALKTIWNKKRPTSRSKRRFQREIKTLHRLNHPNVVSVHSCGSEGGFDWYVMDLVEGEDLSRLLKAGRLSRRERLEVFLQVCAAVQHAHDSNVIHRDLKPANVLVENSGKAYVLDFGLAKLLDDDDPTGLTRTGVAVGTPEYMTPEIVQNAKAVDHRTDVFALGLLLYKLLLDRHPFPGRTAGEIYRKILNSTPEPPSRADPELLPGFDPIISKALAKAPDERYQSVASMQRDVGALLRGRRPHSSSSLSASLLSSTSVGELRESFDQLLEGQSPTRLVGLGFALASLFFVPMTATLLLALTR